jgi:hypothetical protein
MRFADPVFLIPSTVFHTNAAPIRHGAFWRFTFEASMAAKSNDQWHRYRVETLELGQRLLEIMRELRKQRGLTLAAREFTPAPDLVWVRPHAA